MAESLPMAQRLLSRVVGSNDRQSLAGREPVMVRRYRACEHVRRLSHERNGSGAGGGGGGTMSAGTTCTHLWGLMRKATLMTSTIGWAPSEARVRENEEMNAMIDGAFGACFRRPAWATNLWDEDTEEDDPAAADIEIEFGKF
jgi:hypothetical protein